MERSSSISLVNLIIQADVVVQFVILFLFISSLISWAIIFDKFIKFKLLDKRSDKFEDLFEENVLLEEIYNEAKENNNHPLALIFISCIQEWKSNNIKKIIAEEKEKKESLKNRLYSSMMVATNISMQKLESGLNFLAITGSVAPFVGLFGTVWGTMTSFRDIAISKNTSLAVVAPGIAESLLATTIGLFVAIPAVMFYNIFSNKINSFQDRVNNFSTQLLNTLSRELDK